MPLIIKNLSKKACFKIAITSLAVVTFQASALPILIPKPGVHSHGQEAGRNGVAQVGDYSLLGAYKLGLGHTDTSGGAYLFDNGHPNPVQLFSLEQGVTVTDQFFIQDETGQLVLVDTEECFVEHPQGAQLGHQVDMSETWVALGASYFGRGTSQERPGAPCGTIPTVFLAKKSLGAMPFGHLDYSVTVPFRDSILSLAVSDVDLAIMTVKGVFIYSWSNEAWKFNTSFVIEEGLSTHSHGLMEIDGGRLIVGNPSARTIHVIQKNQTNWSLLSSYESPTAGNEFGRGVDISGDRFIVASNDSTEFFKIVGDELISLGRDLSFSAERVAISGNNAVAGLRFAGNTGATKKYVFVESSIPVNGDDGDFVENGSIQGVNELPNNPSTSPWFVDDIDMDGNTIVAGWRAYESDEASLVGALVYDKAQNVFDEDRSVLDDAEGERLWVDVGDYRWQKHDNTSTNATGPSSGYGSPNYYYVETSSGHANSLGDTAILESGIFDRSYKTLSFNFHMFGEDVGWLYVDVMINGAWINGVWSRFGQNQANINSQWQHSGEIAITGTAEPSKVRIRYVANGGEQGSIAVDNILLRYFPCDQQNSTQALNYSEYLVDNGSCLKYSHGNGFLRLGSWDSIGDNYYDIKNCSGEFFSDIAQVQNGFTAVGTGDSGCEHYIYVKQAYQPYRLKFGSW